MPGTLKKRIVLAALAAILCLHGRASDNMAGALPALVQLLADSDDAQLQLDILKGMSEGLKGSRDIKAPHGWEAVEKRLGASPNAGIRELVKSLSLTFGSASAQRALRQALADSGARLEARTNALNALLQARDPYLVPVLRELLREPAIRGVALRALAAFDDPGTPAAILGVYSGLTVAERKDALNTLASRGAYARALVDALERKQIATRDLTADLVRQLRNLKDRHIDSVVERLWGMARESGEDKKQEIARYKAILSKPGGDRGRGRLVYTRICQQCHTLFGEGGKVGPDITGSNRADLDYILETVIDPNAVIPNDYRTSTIELKDERVITGIIARQDDTSLSVVTANETLLLSRMDIQSIQHSEFSMMPEGLIQSLSETEVRDLIAYLASPAQVAAKE